MKYDMDNPYVHYGKPLLGTVLTVVALCGGMVTIGGESFRSNYWQYVMINGTYLAVIGYLIWIIFEFRGGRFKLPKVRMVKADLGILICDPEDWLGFGSEVAIYHNDSDYERPLASGSVYNVQANGLIQIRILDNFDSEEQEAFLDRIKEIQICDIIIKPGQDWRR